MQELLTKEYIIPIGFIPNKTFSYNDNPEKLINDRSILEIFVNKQVLEVKDVHKTENIQKAENINVHKVEETKEESDNDEPSLNDKLMVDYTNMQFNDGLESDSD
jgi:hypothetical protein